MSETPQDPYTYEWWDEDGYHCTTDRVEWETAWARALARSDNTIDLSQWHRVSHGKFVVRPGDRFAKTTGERSLIRWSSE